MKKVTILNKNKVPGWGQILRDDEVQKWIETETKNNSWGKVGDFHVIIDEFSKSYGELRKEQYQRRVDPHRDEAIMESFQGKPEKLQALLAEYNKIKQEFPKPAGISDSKESGEAEWL